MLRIKDLSPKLTGLETAQQELFFPEPLVPIGQRIGGLAMYSNAFRRGAGENVFGSDENGIWLGAANFEDAPFSVDMAGNAVLNSVAVGNYLTKGGANQAVSGQIIVGGSVNGSLLVKDSSNNTKVTLDQSGLVILGGKVEIRDDTSAIALDAKGIVSLTGFVNVGTTSVSAFNEHFTSGSFVTMTGAELTFTLTRSAYVLFLADFNHYMYWDGAGDVYGHGMVSLEVDGDEYKSVMSGGVDTGVADSIGNGNNATAMSHSHRLEQLGAGSHTVKLRAAREAIIGSPEFVIYRYKLSYIILGH
jgi:hypothetical protein